MITEELSVNLGQRSYPIVLGTGLASCISEKVEKITNSGRPLAVLTDEKAAAAQPEFFEACFSGLPVLKMRGGEQSKSIRQLAEVWNFLSDQRIDRSGGLCIFGGGVVGDLGGFAAASFLRGISFYQIPTTLLAMVDSSVGGKTGINLESGKNLVGAFHQPSAVFVDTGLLNTLPPREFPAGMAEVIKYGMLGDAELFDQLNTTVTVDAADPRLPGIIRRCCSLKADVVAADEREDADHGGRALLNLGHTFAHAIEATAGYGDYLHGEAVAIGLSLATQLSVHLGKGDCAEVSRVNDLLRRYGLPTTLKTPLPLADLMSAMGRDKKVRKGRSRFVIMEQIGSAVTADGVDNGLVEVLWRHAGSI